MYCVYQKIKVLKLSATGNCGIMIPDTKLFSFWASYKKEEF